MDVKTLCLGVLSRGPHTGYEIRKQFEDGPFRRLRICGVTGGVEEAEGSTADDEEFEEFEPALRRDRHAHLGRRRQRQRQEGREQEAQGGEGRRHRGHEVLRQLEGCDLSSRPSGEAFVTRYGMAMHRAAKEFFETHQHELIGSLLNAKVAE